MGELVPFPGRTGQSTPDTGQAPAGRQGVDQAPPAGPAVDEQPTTTAAPAVEGDVYAQTPDGEWGPVLPDWAKSRTAFYGRVKAVGRRWSYRTRWHLVRSPKYGARVAVRTVRGAGRGAWRFGRWVTAAEFAPVIQDAATRGQWVDARDNVLQRGKVAAQRVKRLAYSSAGGAAALLVGTAVVGPDLLYALAAVATASATAAGWKGRTEAPILDAPTLDATQDLNMEILNSAFRAAGVLKADAELRRIAPIMRDGRGWAAVVDMPRGGGKTAADAIAKRDVLAAELGVDEIQVVMGRVRANAGGHAARITLWVADDDPYIGPNTTSPLVGVEQWSIWDAVPFGRDARGERIELSLLEHSMFFGGLPGRGKSSAQRLPSAAGVLDPYVRHYVADGKGGADWRAMRAVAYRLVLGAEPDALEAFLDMLREILADMERRFALFGTLPPSVCPDGKLTPYISRKYNLPVCMVTIDELQEFLTALPKEDREEAVNMMARIVRRGRAGGYIPNFASQRPDADSVPTKLREVIDYRFCTQVTDKASSDMVLGKGKAAMGADASVLEEYHKGVGVLLTGPGSYVTVRCDYMDMPAFLEIGQRGRELRKAAGTLEGDAAGDALAAADDAGYQVPQILADVLEVMRHSDRMHTSDVLAGLVNIDEDTYGNHTPDQLATELAAARVKRSTTQVKIGNVNRNGWYKSDLQGALPLDFLTRHQ
jgi:S-DNA-T family DNA segregation ATPase FtsK/SpoIIIE